MQRGRRPRSRALNQEGCDRPASDTSGRTRRGWSVAMKPGPWSRTTSRPTVPVVTSTRAPGGHRVERRANVVSMYAKGLTAGEIQHLAETYGTEVSKETISKISGETSGRSSLATTVRRSAPRAAFPRVLSISQFASDGSTLMSDVSALGPWSDGVGGWPGVIRAVWLHPQDPASRSLTAEFRLRP